MEEGKKLLIMRILVIIGALILLLNFFVDIASGSVNYVILILYPAIAIFLIIICLKPDVIPNKGILLLILGIVILILGILFNFGLGLVGIIIAGILVALAGILDLVIKS